MVSWFLLSVLVAGARGEQRRFQDSDVAASQRFFMVSWRDQFNLGHAEYCGNSYLSDASLHVSLGPAAAELQQVAGFSNPTVLRGKDSILHFWETTQRIPGLSKINPVEDQGEFAATSFVVDDDHVIVSSRLAFDAVHGQVLSQEWVRVGDDDWKIKSDMIVFQELRGPLGKPTAPEPVPGALPSPAPPASEAFLPAAVEHLPAAPGPAAELAAIAIDDRGRPLPAVATQPTLAPQPGAVPPPPAPDAKKGDGEDFLLMLGVAAACVLAFIFVRRRNKREVKTDRFDSMLG